MAERQSGNNDEGRSSDRRNNRRVEPIPESRNVGRAADNGWSRSIATEGISDTNEPPRTTAVEDRPRAPDATGSRESETVFPVYERTTVRPVVEDRIRHAKSYPFAIPDRAYVYRNGAVEPYRPAEVEREGRIPVLAAGSNQSPEQIARKYARLEGEIVIPAQRGYLWNFDSVYAAHITGYGSVPATFRRAPGTAVSVFVLWLNDAQLARMHETEGSYTFDRLDSIRLALDGTAETLTSAFAYSSRVGCLNVGGACVALAAIAARGRRFPARAQPEILGVLRDRQAPGQKLDDFIRDCLDDDGLRRARSHALGRDALPLAYRRQIVASP